MTINNHLKYPITKTNLIRAICRHKSYLDKHIAISRYKYEQESLASLGDKLIAFAAKEYCAENKYNKSLANILNSNECMYYFVQDIGLAQYLLYDKSRMNRKRIQHTFGTFFEAIVAGIYVEYGWDKVKNYILQDYIHELSIVIKILTNKNLQSALHFLYDNQSDYRTLKLLIEKTMHSSIKISEKKDCDDRITIVLKCILPKPFLTSSNPLIITIQGYNYIEMIENISKQCLKKIKENI